MRSRRSSPLAPRWSRWTSQCWPPPLAVRLLPSWRRMCCAIWPPCRPCRCYTSVVTCARLWPICSRSLSPRSISKGRTQTILRGSTWRSWNSSKGASATAAWIRNRGTWSRPASFASGCRRRRARSVPAGSGSRLTVACAGCPPRRRAPSSPPWWRRCRTCARVCDRPTWSTLARGLSIPGVSTWGASTNSVSGFACPGDALQLLRAPIQCDVLFRRGVPGVIGQHGAQHQPMPHVLELIDGKRPDDSRKQVEGVVRLEREPIAAIGVGIELLHGIRQPASAVHDRDAAIAHRQHLADAARLEAGRHQVHVRAGIDTLADLRVKAEMDGHLTRIARGKALEHLVVVLVASAGDHELHALLDERDQHLIQKIKALLIRQARDHAHHGDARLNGQVHVFLQGCFVRDALFERKGVEMRGDVPVASRVELLGVDAVQDAVEPVAPLAQHGIEPLAKLRREDLLRIARAHGADGVGEDDATPHQVHDIRQLGHGGIDEALLPDAGHL